MINNNHRVLRELVPRLHDGAHPRRAQPSWRTNLTKKSYRCSNRRWNGVGRPHTSRPLPNGNATMCYPGRRTENRYRYTYSRKNPRPAEPHSGGRMSQRRNSPCNQNQRSIGRSKTLRKVTLNRTPLRSYVEPLEVEWCVSVSYRRRPEAAQ